MMFLPSKIFPSSGPAYVPLDPMSCGVPFLPMTTPISCLYSLESMDFFSKPNPMVTGFLLFFISTNLISLTMACESVAVWPTTLFLLSIVFWCFSMSPIVSLAFTAFGTFSTPANVPLVLCGFLFFIEVSSTLARSMILGIRLSANILGGHLFCELAEPLLGLLTVLLVYEVFIGTMQAFIFNSLVGLYFAEGDDHV